MSNFLSCSIKIQYIVTFMVKTVQRVCDVLNLWFLKPFMQIWFINKLRTFIVSLRLAFTQIKQ